MSDFRSLVESLRALETIEEGFSSEAEMTLHKIAQDGDEEALIDAMSGLMGNEVRDILDQMKEDLFNTMHPEDIDQVADDEDKLVELLMDKVVDEYSEGDFDDGQPSSYDEYQDLDGGDDWDHGQYGESQILDRVTALKEKLAQFKETYLKEFGADNGPAPTGQMDPEQLKTQNTIKANLNQLKGAGVDIDPNKGLDDPKNAGEIGAKVQAAMADPAMANQIKSVLQRIKN